METAYATRAEPRVDATDFLRVGRLLTDEERLVASTTRRFVAEHVLTGVATWFERGVFPVELASEVGRLGLLGMDLEGYGCADAGPVSYGLACLELEAGDSGFRSFVSVQGSLCMYPIWRFGSDEQKAEWLPRMARGEAIGCFGLTEPDVGSDPSSMRTSARRRGTDWVLNGTKLWITNGTIADVAIVWARTDDGVRAFLVSRGTPGFAARDIERKLSLRASVTSELSFDDVVLPSSAMLPGAEGVRAALACLNEARYGIVWGAMGAARSCFESALGYARTRSQFGKTIASYQLTQRRLVEMLLELEKGMLISLHLGRLKEASMLGHHHVSLGKLNNVRAALDIAREARALFGAAGITLDHPVMRHMLNLESVVTYEGTSEIHTLSIGHAITGVSAFRS